jgi:hypothetical protein
VSDWEVMGRAESVNERKEGTKCYSWLFLPMNLRKGVK